MGKQGHGIGKGKPKLKDRGFGNALIRQQQIGVQGMNGLNYYKDIEIKKTLMSNLESDDLSEYVEGLQLAQKDIDVHRVTSDATAAYLVEGTLAPQTVQAMTISNFTYEHLPVPRKPSWNRKMTAEDVDMNERSSFLEWRRKLALMEEANAGAFKATPFEKNLEVWRQLWRVLEKSDFALQIVDARNPLLYYNNDLTKYSIECQCPMLVLVNKADFLTEYQRRSWVKYFNDNNITFAFYSAANAQKSIDIEAKLTPREAHGGLEDEEISELDKARKNLIACDDDEIDSIASDICDQWVSNSVKSKSSSININTKEKSVNTKVQALENAETLRRQCRILTRTELVLLLQLIPEKLEIIPQIRHNGHICIGMTGFPNVGKSSAINSILGVSKSTHGVTRVAVSSTPGKTKHFQTLIVNENVMLCDCPGLVFPSFMRSTGEMLCAGILPINQMRHYEDPANVITARVPMHLIEAAYGIKIIRDIDIKDNPNRPPKGSEMLCAYCATKGYITNGTGRWDEFRACKEIIKDFCDGLLLFVSPPDTSTSTSTSTLATAIIETTNNNGSINIDEFDINRWLQDTENIMMRKERIADRLATARIKDAEEAEAEAAANGNGSGITDGSVRVEVSIGHQGEMVFGDGRWNATAASMASPVPSVFQKIVGNSDVVINNDVITAGASAGAGASAEVEGEFQYDDESSEDESNTNNDAEPELTVHGKIKREHKGRAQWGKKNRKLRDKNPYGEATVRVNNVNVIAQQTSSRLPGSRTKFVSNSNINVSSNASSDPTANYIVGVKDRNKTGYKPRADISNVPQRDTTIRQRVAIPSAAINKVQTEK
jgi:large subunit GTPase 1